jgi:RNA polymerase sigma factor (sigma-70 family)
MSNQVLYIEDELDYQILVKRILNKAGIAVKTADTAEEGYRQLEKSRPGLLLLDINLPGADGYSVCRKIRAEAELLDMPVLMLTVRRRPEEWLEGFGSGADDYLSKPLNPPELVERVISGLQGKSRRAFGSGGPEHQLIQAALAGNRTAFEVLIQRYRCTLTDYIRAYARSPDELEDIVSRAYLIAYKKMHLFRGDSSFLTWICRIAINEANHERRKTPVVYLEDCFRGRGERGCSQLSEPDRSGEGLINQSKKEQLKTAIRRVPRRYREMLKWRHIQNLPCKNISDRLKVPLGTVMSRLFTARRLLIKAWKKAEAGPNNSSN